jgi:hypothetical protein
LFAAARRQTYRLSLHQPSSIIINTMAKKRRQEPEPEEEEEEDSANEDLSEDDDDDVDDEEVLSSEEEDDGDDDDDSPAEPTPLPVIQASTIKSDGRYQNKQRLLVLSSRGVTARYRHLLEDLRTLLPHSKKECKLDVGTYVIVRHILDMWLFN